MSIQCSENQVISELYGKTVIKEEGEASPRLSQPQAAAPMGSLEAHDATVRLLAFYLNVIRRENGHRGKNYLDGW